MGGGTSCAVRSATPVSCKVACDVVAMRALGNGIDVGGNGLSIRSIGAFSAKLLFWPSTLGSGAEPTFCCTYDLVSAEPSGADGEDNAFLREDAADPGGSVIATGGEGSFCIMENNRWFDLLAASCIGLTW